MIGIPNRFRVAAAIPVTASVALVTSTLSFPIAANQIVHARFFLTFSVGAAGGGRFQLVVPAAVSNFAATLILYNNVAPSITTSVQTASAAFTNAIANAGNHNLAIEFDLANGVNAGTVDLQFAQNTSDATPITLFQGSFADVVYL